jgi:hypothetical protein
MRSIWLAICCAACWAQSFGTTPKPKAEDYEVHNQAGTTGVGVEYMVHSFSSGEQMYLVNGFLVVEVALYPPKGSEVHVERSAFKLRVNGKGALATEPPQDVVAELLHPSQRSGPRLESGGGLGPVIMGTPQPTGPGNPPVNRPQPPRAPDTSGVEKQEPESETDLLMRTALPEGDYPGAVSGFLYFPYSGKTKSVKSVELLCYGLSLKLK